MSSLRLDCGRKLNGRPRFVEGAHTEVVLARAAKEHSRIVSSTTQVGFRLLGEPGAVWVCEAGSGSPHIPRGEGGGGGERWNWGASPAIEGRRDRRGGHEAAEGQCGLLYRQETLPEQVTSKLVMNAFVPENERGTIAMPPIVTLSVVTRKRNPVAKRWQDMQSISIRHPLLLVPQHGTRR